MAQSTKELEILQKNNQRKKSASNMASSKAQMMKMVPKDVFDWDVDALDAGLKELCVTIRTNWSKSKKAFELNMAI